MQIVRLNCAFSRNLGRGDDVDGLGAIMRGSLKSTTYYDDHGRMWYRYDYLGAAHRNTLPHVHKYIYHIGGRIEERTYDLNWNLIDIRWK